LEKPCRVSRNQSTSSDSGTFVSKGKERDSGTFVSKGKERDSGTIMLVPDFHCKLKF